MNCFLLSLEELPEDQALACTALFQLKLPDDVHQQACLEILQGKPLEKAVRHARAEIHRQQKSCAWVSFDDKNEGDVKLLERLPASPPVEFEKWRTESLDDATELMLEFLAQGTAALSHDLNLTQRRVQQIIKFQVEKIQKGDLFGGEMLS